MKKLVIIILLFFILSCENKIIIYDENNKPKEKDIKSIALKSLKSISADPKSVDINDIFVPYYCKEPNQYGNDIGWVTLVNFNWVNMKGQRERQIWYFAITSNITATLPDQNTAKLFYETEQNKYFKKTTNQ